ncbi:hypothetical protein PINS_up010310 [Pythium insidiosum]|nr:hypothetical protein PINS_up010310 [Pythium insidiosum]
MDMERWIADFDPLAALEAEYAAVLAQSNPSRLAPSAARAAPSVDDAVEHNREEDDDNDNEDDDDEENGYAPLPSSPMGSDDGALAFGDDAEHDDSDPSEDATARDQPTPPAPPAPMDDRVKHEIMTSMQRLRLPTPPWAAGADALSDQELIELVQRRLRSSSLSRVAATQGLPTPDGGDDDDGNRGTDDRRPLAANVA